jgi:hypothetical protein
MISNVRQRIIFPHIIYRWDGDGGCCFNRRGAVSFIRPVRTIFVSVAKPGLEDAQIILALEEIHNSVNIHMFTIFRVITLNCQLSHILAVQFFSSEPSVQSGSPSHFHAVGMHCAVVPPQRNSVPPQVTGLVDEQFFSSDPSLQSSSRSQTHLWLMHRPLLHLNWLLEQLEYSEIKHNIYIIEYFNRIY